MPDVILDLLIHARDARPDPAAVARQVAVSAQHTFPSAAAVVEAIALGSAQVMAALLDSPLLDKTGRAALATRALMAWNENPLAHGTSAKMLKVLMQRGANANMQIARGDTVAERLGERLGTIEGNEARAMEKGKLRYPTVAGQILNECWQIMEECGVDMAEARRVRNMAMEPAGITLRDGPTQIVHIRLG